MHNSLAKMDALSELKSYQDQPKQMSLGAQGKMGVLELKFEKKKHKSVLSHLHREAPLLVQQALYWDESWPQLPICSIITVGGGTLQGDRFYIDIHVTENAEAKITTQSATRIQAMDSNYATQYQNMRVDSKGYLEYVPDTTILYKNSRYACQNNITVAEDGVLIYGETIMLGRKHHNNERYEYELFSSLNNIYRPTGELIFSEKILSSQHDQLKDFNAVMKGYDVFSNIICILPEELIQRVTESYPFHQNDEQNLLSGISLLPNNAGVILRVVGKESYHVHAEIKKFVTIIKDFIKPYLRDY